jgi:hypothetical protein
MKSKSLLDQRPAQLLGIPPALLWIVGGGLVGWAALRAYFRGQREDPAREYARRVEDYEAQARRRQKCLDRDPNSRIIGRCGPPPMDPRRYGGR